MEEIKPVVVDGISHWNVPSNSKAKRAYNRKFEEIITKIKLAEEKVLGRVLNEDEISALRRHPDLGVWIIDGKPATVKSLNGFFNPNSKVKTLSLNASAAKSDKYFTREYIESAANRDAVLSKWYKRLEGKWPEGFSKKGFIKYLQDSYDQTSEYNKILKKRLGFKFDVGHFWGSMGPEDNRTILGPYGANSSGKFTFKNVTSQPKTPKMAQLLNPIWNVITPNVPGFFDERNVQIGSASELLEAGFGGQGWEGALAEYLTKDLDNINEFDAWEKAYIAFGDENKGAGSTIEIRKAELLEPGGKDKVLTRIADFSETAVAESGPVRNVPKGSAKWWQITDNLNSSSLFNIGVPTLTLGGVDKTLGITDFLLPSEETVSKVRKEGITQESITSYGKDLLSTGTTYGALKGVVSTAAKIKPLVPFIGKGMSILSSPPALVAGAVMTINEVDNRLFDGMGKKVLDEIRPSWPYQEEGEKEFDKNARDYARKGGFDVSGYTF